MAQIRIFERFFMGINGGAAKFLLVLIGLWGAAALGSPLYGLSSGIAIIFPRKIFRYLGNGRRL